MATTRLDKGRVVALLALAAGSSKRAAAGKAGISWSTFCRWQQEEEFAEAVEVATGQGRSVYEDLLRQAAEKDWRAALALYEHIYLEPKARRAGDDSTLLPTPEPEAVWSDAEAEERIAKVMAILRKSLGSEEAAEEVVRSHARRLRLLPD